MVFPLGVSVGDFIGGIEFICSVKEAFEETAGSQAQYQGVLSTLQSSTQALRQLNALVLTLGPEDRQNINEIIERYKQTTAVLDAKVQKFESSLGKHAPDHWWRALPRYSGSARLESMSSDSNASFCSILHVSSWSLRRLSGALAAHVKFKKGANTLQINESHGARAHVFPIDRH